MQNDSKQLYEYTVSEKSEIPNRPAEDPPSAGLFGAPSGRMFQRVKVPNPPDSGKDIAKSKGVLGNWESEGSWRQITGLTNRNHEG